MRMILIIITILKESINETNFTTDALNKHIPSSSRKQYKSPKC